MSATMTQTAPALTLTSQKVMGKTNTKAEPAWWANGAFVIVSHIVAVLALILYTPATQTKWLTFISWQLASLGITVGYHRLWSHRAYTAEFPFRAALAFMGTLGVQGSIKWWVLRHRLHHRFTDSDHDPYSATKGFWFSHITWIFKKPSYPRMKLIDQSDLNGDPIVVFQHKHYVPLAFFSAFVLPTFIAALWGDALGGFLYGGFLARLMIWHSTFCINSFAHWAGDQLYSNEVSARGNVFLAVLTGGEGYHNFHHEFPKDYRNGWRLWDYDPSKWIIWFFHKFTAQVPTVDRIPLNEIRKARADMELIKAQEMREKYDWGVDPATLPVMTYSEYKAKVQDEGKEWLLIDSFVADVSSFKAKHPGGAKILKPYYGKDASRAFFGGFNNHTKSARALLAMLRVARVENLDNEQQ